MASYAAGDDSAPPADDTDDAAPADVELPSLTERVSWYDDQEMALQKPRALSRRDRRYYDNEQWTQEAVAELDERGQRPATNNRLARKVNTELGNEIERRVDVQARPRQPAHRESARTITDALRYVTDAQEFHRVSSAVMKDVLVEGFGGALCSMDDDGCITATHIHWDRLFYDHHSRDPLFRDARFRGIIIWQDLDEAIADHPHAEDALRAAVANNIGVNANDVSEDKPGHWFAGDRKRPRVKICEMYTQIGADWWRFCFTRGADIDEPERTWLFDEKRKKTVCPLPMVSGYIDQEGYRYGILRALISRQDTVNHSESKATHLISTKQVIAEKGAFTAEMNPDRVMEELAKPDGFIEVAAGALSEKRFQIVEGRELAVSHIAFMQSAIADIDGIGPTSSNLPDLPEDVSGRAQQMRAKSANKEMASVYDSMNAWRVEFYKLDWLAVRWNWNEEKWMRVTDSEELEGYRFVGINRKTTRAQRFMELIKRQPPLSADDALNVAAGIFAPQIMASAQWALAQATQGKQLPPAMQQQYLVQIITGDVRMQQQVTVDQVDEIDVDIVLDEIRDTAVIEQEEFEEWIKLVPSLIQAGFDPREAAKITVQLSDFRDAKKVLELLDKPPPQNIAAQQQAQAIQQLQQQLAQLQAALLGAQVQKTQADARLSDARAAALANEDGSATAPTIGDIAHATHEHALAQRETVQTQLDINESNARVQRDQAMATKHKTDALVSLHKAAQPEVVIGVDNGRPRKT